MHICPEEIAILLATVPALRYLVAWLIRQRAVRAVRAAAHPTLHCQSCHEEIKEAE